MCKISIIIPVYNTEMYIEKCLNSIINQTYSNLEIICVNNGSTDKSKEILKMYSFRDKRIKVIETVNNGVSDARNIGIHNVSGQYVMFVDSDDWIDVSTCELAIKKIKENESDVLFFNYIKEFESNSVPVNLKCKKDVFVNTDLKKVRRRLIGPIDNELESPLLADIYCTVWAKLYRFDCIKSLKFIDLDKIGTFEDGIFNIEVTENIKSISYLDNYLYHYRKNNLSSTLTKYSIKLVEKYEELFNYMYKICEDKKDVVALNNKICIQLITLILNEIKKKNYKYFKTEFSKIYNYKIFNDALRHYQKNRLPIVWRIIYFFIEKKYIFFLYIIFNILQKLRGK